ncbi:hypothetical protein Q5752_004815 [Cryptotrichosporon argae]
MSVVHIVAFSATSPSALAELTAEARKLQAGCKKPSGETYIRSVKAGKQVSPEGKDHGMQIVFVMEFANQNDLDYYLWKDEYHDAFKTQIAPGRASGVVAMDFVDGAW